MDLSIALKIAKDPESSAEKLDDLYDRYFGEVALQHSDELDRLLARHPKVSVAVLEYLSHSGDKTTRKYVVGNPNVGKEVLVKLAPQFPGDFFKNPAFDWLLVEHPNLMAEIGGGVLKNVLKRPECPASFLNWAAAHGSEQERLAVAMNPNANVEALQAIERKGGKAEQAARQHANHPDARGEDDLESAFRNAVAQAITEGFRRSRDLPTLAQWSALSVAHKLDSASRWRVSHIDRTLRDATDSADLRWTAAVAKLKPKDAELITACKTGDILYLPDKAVEKSCRKKMLSWRLLGLSHRLAPLDVLAMSAHSSAWEERMAVARNPSTPRHVIESLCRDAHRLVAGQAKATSMLRASAIVRQSQLLQHLPDESSDKALAKETAQRLRKCVWLDARLFGSTWGQCLAPGQWLLALDARRQSRLDSVLSDDLKVVIAEFWADPSVPAEIHRRLALPSALAWLAKPTRKKAVQTAVARNVNTPIDVLRSLALSRFEDVRCCVANNSATPAESLTVLARDSSVDVRLRVADNSATPTAVRIELASELASGDRSWHLCKDIARNPVTPPAIRIALLSISAKKLDWQVREDVAKSLANPVEIQTVLSSDSDWRVRSAVARNSTTRAATLIALAGDAHQFVRSCVAGNQATPAEVLTALAGDFNQEVRCRIAGNPLTPVETLTALAGESNDYWDSPFSVRRAVVNNPATSEEALTALFCDPDSESDVREAVRCAIAKNSATTAAILTALAGDSESYLRCKVAGNPATPAAILKVLAADSDLLVRQEVERNPNTPLNIRRMLLAALAGDSESYVRCKVAENPATPEDSLTALFGDADLDVFIAAANNPNAPAVILGDSCHSHLHRPSVQLLIGLHQSLGAEPPSPAQLAFIRAWVNELQTALDVPVVLQGVSDDEFRLAFVDLGLIPAAADKQAITEAIKSDDWLQRAAVTYVIGVQPSLLMALLEDPVEAVRQSAGARLRSLEAEARDRASLASICPNCSGTVKEDSGNYACCGVEGAASGCGFSFNKTQAGRVFKPAEVDVLLREHKSGLLRGFISKAGKPFNAEMVLRFDEAKKTCRVVFDFVKDKKVEPLVLATATAADVAPQPSLGACPKCGAAVHAHGTNYVCTNSLVSPAQAVPSCDFKTGQVILQQAISAEQLGKLLATGRTDQLAGFISARTQKAFKAMLVWDAKAGKVGFEFGSSRN